MASVFSGIANAFTGVFKKSDETLTTEATAARKAIVDARKGGDPEAIKKAKQALDDANTALKERNLPEVLDSDTGTAALGGRRRRKHKGTRRHKKGKSKRARTGRKSSRL